MTDVTAVVKSVSRNFQLLQKAETFLLRKIIKVRDAYDIKQLVGAGAVLDDTLRTHLEDDLKWEEIEGAQISARIERIDAKRCNAELATILPAAIFTELQAENFLSLRKCVSGYFQLGFRKEGTMDWAKTIADEAQTSTIINSDALADKTGTPIQNVRVLLKRQQARGLVEPYVAHKLYINKLSAGFNPRDPGGRHISSVLRIFGIRAE